MIIHTPDIKSDSVATTASARIEFETEVPDMPDRLWFEFPSSQENMVTESSNGFLTAMLLLAMKYGENIRVRGDVSSRLIMGMEEYQRVFKMWFPKQYSLVDIDCDSISEPQSNNHGSSVVCAFSGGVDSFFSLWKHLPDNAANEPSQITHTLFVHGFDIRIEEEGAFIRIRNLYAKMFDKLGVEFLTATTNIQHFGTRANWGIFHGTAMIGLAHVLGTKVSKFYIPASHTYADLVPWGTDPRIDHLLSTESTEIIHDGAAFTRVEKTEAISRWPVTFDKLRVCVPGGNRFNCCRCEKCLRTMLTLDMLGVLESYKAFDAPMDMKFVRGCRYHNASDFAFPREIIHHAVKLRKKDIVLNVGYAVLKSRLLQLWHFTRIRLIRMKRAVFG